MSVLETEYHYLLICQKLYDLRTKHIKKILYMAYPTQTNTSSKSNITVQNLSSLPIELEIKYLAPHLLLLYLYYFAFTSSKNS